MRKRDLIAAPIGALTATVLAGGVAWAAIPGDGGVIQSCYDSGGNLKVAAALPCPKGYTPLAWNQQGPKGDKGDKGDPGIPGPQGNEGPSGVSGYRILTEDTPASAGAQIVKDVSCGAGSAALNHEVVAALGFASTTTRWFPVGEFSGIRVGISNNSVRDDVVRVMLACIDVGSAS